MGRSALTGLIRVDGSESTGTGHVSRTLLLAEELRKRQVVCSFLLRASGKRFRDVISERGFKVDFLSESITTWKDEVLQVSEKIKTDGPDFVLLDSRENSSQDTRSGCELYLNELKKFNKPLISIDGFFNLDFEYSLLFLPYVGGERDGEKFSRAEMKAPGPSYFMLPEAVVKTSSEPRVIRAKASHLLITFGGSDPEEITEKALETLAPLAQGSLEIKVLIGRLFDANRIERLRAQARINIEFIEPIPNLRDILLWADLVIVSGGLTKYDAAACGTPAIAICQNEYENEYTAEFSKKGSLVNLGVSTSVRASRLFEEVENLIKDVDRRSEMSKNGKALIDRGRGAEKSAEVLVDLLRSVS